MDKTMDDVQKHNPCIIKQSMHWRNKQSGRYQEQEAVPLGKTNTAGSSFIHFVFYPENQNTVIRDMSIYIIIKIH
jgi:hypothetical protein